MAFKSHCGLYECYICHSRKTKEEVLLQSLFIKGENKNEVRTELVKLGSIDPRAVELMEFYFFADNHVYIANKLVRHGTKDLYQF